MIKLNDPVTVEGAKALGGTAHGSTPGELRWVTFGKHHEIEAWSDGKVMLKSGFVPITTMGQLALLLSLLGLGDNSLDSQIAEAITTDSRDVEANHAAADDMLVEIVLSAKFTKTVDAFTKLRKWYS